MACELDRVPRAFRAPRMELSECGASVSDRQERVEGWDQEAMAEAEFDLVGSGGIGWQVALFLAKAGAGTLRICEPDVVEPSNLNRQFFGASDVGCYKAHVVARRVCELSGLGTAVIGYPLYFRDYEERYGAKAAPRLVVSGVDNNRARNEAERWARKKDIPHVVLGAARDASSAYVFVSEPGSACLGCYLGDSLSDERKSPCAGTAAVLDVLQAICGFANYAISSLVMNRKREWNLVQAFMKSGTAKPARVERRKECRTCEG